jgi:hypothetical protein
VPKSSLSVPTIHLTDVPSVTKIPSVETRTVSVRFQGFEILSNRYGDAALVTVRLSS